MYMTIISETKMDITSSTLELTAENVQYEYGIRIWHTQVNIILEKLFRADNNQKYERDMDTNIV